MNQVQIEAVQARCMVAKDQMGMFVAGDAVLNDAIGRAKVAISEVERLCEIRFRDKTEQEAAERAYPDHHPNTALANYRAGREVWDTNGDMR